MCSRRDLSRRRADPRVRSIPPEAERETSVRQTLLKWLRRTHLYAGLVLAPWVLMYGMSGFVFNHGEWFSGDDPNQRAWPVDPSAATHRLDADALAGKAIAALNQRADGGDEVSEWRLRAGSQPRFEGAITMPGEDTRGGSVLLVLDPAADEAGPISRRRRPPGDASRSMRPKPGCCTMRRTRCWRVRKQRTPA
jgi:hypothetical protein